MRGLSQFMKLAGTALILVLLVFSSLQSTAVRAGVPAQATVAATTATGETGAGGTSGTGSTSASAMLPPCAPSTAPSSAGSSAGSATAAANAGAASGAAGAAATQSVAGATTHQPAYVGVQVTGVSNCGVSVVQIDPSSPAASQLQVGDIVVAVDCVPLTGWFTSTSSSNTSGNSGTSGSNSSSGTSSTGNAAAGTGCTAMLSPGAST